METIATLRPLGTGWASSTRATSKSSDAVLTRMTPLWASRAATVASVGQAADRPSGPAEKRVGPLRPLFTATIGVFRASERAIRVNLRGLPNDSRNSATTVVVSSAAQYCNRSLPDTSSLAPTSTNWEMPTPRRWACSRAAMPSVPDWVRKPTPPGRTTTGANVPCNEMPSAVLITPIDSGPRTRMPTDRARSTMRRTVPSGSWSNPALTTIRPPTRLVPHSSTTSSTFAAGTATIARSTSSGTASTDV